MLELLILDSYWLLHLMDSVLLLVNSNHKLLPIGYCHNACLLLVDESESVLSLVDESESVLSLVEIL